MPNETPTDTNSSGARLAALAGLPTAALVIIGTVLVEHGAKNLSPDMSAENLVDGFRDYAGQAEAGAALLGLAAVLHVVFLAALWDRIHPRSGWLSTAVAIGGAVSVLLLLQQATWGYAASVAGGVGDGQTARTLLALEWEYARVGVPAGLVVVGAATLGGFRYGILPRWFCWLGAGLTLMLTVGLVPVGPGGLIGAMTWFWVLLAAPTIAFTSDRRNSIPVAVRSSSAVVEG